MGQIELGQELLDSGRDVASNSIVYLGCESHQLGKALLHRMKVTVRDGSTNGDVKWLGLVLFLACVKATNPTSRT